MSLLPWLAVDAVPVPKSDALSKKYRTKGSKLTVDELMKESPSRERKLGWTIYHDYCIMHNISCGIKEAVSLEYGPVRKLLPKAFEAVDCFKQTMHSQDVNKPGAVKSEFLAFMKSRNTQRADAPAGHPMRCNCSGKRSARCRRPAAAQGR